MTSIYSIFSPKQRPSGELIRAGVPSDHVERLWAYHMIQTLLRDLTLKEDNPAAVEALERQIVDQSLAYQFLNPFTTMTVTEGVGGSEVVMRVTDTALPAYVREELAMALSPRRVVVDPNNPGSGPGTNPGTGPNTGTGPTDQGNYIMKEVF